nr:APC family permease [Streptomyces antimycoticus]
MAFGLAHRALRPRVPLRHGEGDKHHLTSLEGLAALSLDALSSVAYGPEAIVVVLVAAGTGALTATLPITVVITILLTVLVISYRQVIAVHPDGGGAYAVAKKSLGQRVSLLAAASLTIDYVLTVAVSLAAGAASLASAFPILSSHLLAVCLVLLALLTAVNLWGVAESARVLMLPTVLFIVSMLGIVVMGILRSHPAAVVGAAHPVRTTEALGVLLILKAFSSGCSALTGVEAIANGVPMFREPRIKRAQHTELMLGMLLGMMLLGMAYLIRRDRVAPRGGVTVLAQLAAGSYGTGWEYYATNLIVTLVLALAANTSFGGLPVLMSLLARDDRLPHLFGLRAERPVYRYGGGGGAAVGPAAHRGGGRDPSVDPAVRHRGVHRLHHQPGRAGTALGDRAAGRVAAPGDDQRPGGRTDHWGRSGPADHQVPRRGLGGPRHGAAADAAVHPRPALLRDGR